MIIRREGVEVNKKYFSDEERSKSQFWRAFGGSILLIVVVFAILFLVTLPKGTKEEPTFATVILQEWDCATPPRVSLRGTNQISIIYRTSEGLVERVITLSGRSCSER
jgi:hypothetical protein